LLLLLAPSKTAEVTYSAVAEAGGIPRPIWSRFVEAYVARSPVNAIAKGQ
jgi:hypothetical protein